VYDSDNVEEMSRAVAEFVREQLKGLLVPVLLHTISPPSGLQLPNYKYIVQVTLGEMRGQGAK
jgi:hypothetical protein